MIQTNPKPREKFQAEKQWIKGHKELLESPVFDTALDFAMLQFVRELAEDKNAAQMAGPYAMMITGAHKYVEILRGLSSMPVTTPKVLDPDNLNHRV